MADLSGPLQSVNRRQECGDLPGVCIPNSTLRALHKVQSHCQLTHPSSWPALYPTETSVVIPASESSILLVTHFILYIQLFASVTGPLVLHLNPSLAHILQDQ